MGDEVLPLPPQFALGRPVPAGESRRRAGGFLPRRPGAGAGVSADPRRADLWRSRLGIYDWGDTEPGSFNSASSSVPCGPPAWRGAFFAINAHLRQEVQFGGGLTVQAGWQWRGRSGHLFRTGLEDFNGKSEQYQFGDQYEQQIGVGMWYDFERGDSRRWGLMPRRPRRRRNNTADTAVARQWARLFLAGALYLPRPRLMPVRRLISERV